MKNKLVLIFLMFAAMTCHAKEPTEICSIDGDSLKYILAMYDDLQEFPIYVFENNTKKLREIEEVVRNMDFATYNPKDAKEAAWYRFYEDFAVGRPYIHLLNLSDYKIEVSNVGGKVVVDFKSLNRGMWLSEFTYYFDKDGNILERYLKGSPLKPLN